MKPIWCTALLLVAACGDTVNDDSAGGAGGEGGGGASSGSGSSTATGAGGACDEHEDCGPGNVCLFGQGTCAPSCDATDSCESCGEGTACNMCATGSCPGCRDCVAACLPLQAGACDENDACPPDQVCVWEQHLCAPLCDASGGCADPNQICADCVTGSCCGCDNCVSGKL